MSLYEVGLGKAYSHPQAAVDQLVIDTGGSLFTEEHVIRIFAGTYVTSGSVRDPVLSLSGLQPNVTPDVSYPLWIEAAEDNEVIFQGRYGIVSNGNINFVYTKGLKIEINNNDETDSVGIGVAPPGVLDTTPESGWKCEDVEIELTAGSNEGTIGFYTGLSYGHFFTRTKITGFERGIGLQDTDELTIELIVLSIKGCIIDASNECIGFASGIGDQPTIAAVIDGSTFRGTIGLYLNRESTFVWMVCLNSIFDHGVTGGMVFQVPDTGLLNMGFYGDGNLINVDQYLGETKWGYYPRSLEGINAITGQQEHSLITDDVKLDANYVPEADSPALKLGAGHPYKDFNGFLGSRGVLDAGAFQITQAEQVSTEGYCTPEEVILHSGVIYEDLSLNNDVELNTAIQKWINECSDIIDKYCETSWEVGSVPESIRRACIMMVSEIVAMAQQRRKSSIIKVAEFSAKVLHDDVLTEDVKELLDLEYAGGSVEIGDDIDNSGLAMATLSSEDVEEITEEDEWPPRE